MLDETGSAIKTLSGGPARKPVRVQREALRTAAKNNRRAPHGLETRFAMIEREDIVQVLEGYDPSKIRIATIGSHSALDVCDGAIEEGFRTLVFCEKGREAPYGRYFRAVRDKDGRAVRGTVDEAIVLGKFGEVVSPKFQEHLRSVSGVFIPNRSFTSYVDLDAIEDDFRIPIFGSRNLLRTEEREFEKSYYWILEKAKLPTPEKFEQARDIDGLAIVKLPHKVKKLERGFFTAASYPEFREKSQALLKQDVIAIAERYVKATQQHFPPGIIGPFTLQTAVDKDLQFWVYDVSPRIGGGTNVHMSVGHPYGNSLWRRPMSTGRRIAMEVRRGIDTGRLGELVT